MLKMQRKFRKVCLFTKKTVLVTIGFQTMLYLYFSIFNGMLDYNSWDSSKFHYGKNHVLRSTSNICEEKNNFVFIKCMKCATETISTIIRRFGYKRKLNFVLPEKNNIYLGWPYLMERTDYRPSKWPYNIIFEHSIYNHTIMTSLMPNDTVYITSIREPWSRLISSFYYFRMGEISEVPSSDFLEFVRNIEKYDKIYHNPTKHKLRSCLPDNFSVVKNLQGHCLGMPLGFPKGREDISNDLQAVKKYIVHLEKQFSLVMIVEYMYESLILLKRLMCWNFQDIIYHASNVAGHRTTFERGDNFQIYKNYSNIDFLIYDHFNNTFWEKIKEQGEDFYDEIDQFKLVQMLISQFCFIEGNVQTKGNYLTIPKSKFNKEFNLTSEECALMNRYLLIDLRAQYDELEKPERRNMTEKWHEPLRGCSYPIPNS